MIRQHHLLNGHEFEHTPGDSEGQGSLACCSPWGCKVLYRAWRLNNCGCGVEYPNFQDIRVLSFKKQLGILHITYSQSAHKKKKKIYIYIWINIDTK